MSQDLKNTDRHVYLSTKNEPYLSNAKSLTNRSMILENQSKKSDSTKMTVITLVDGSELIGTILEEEENKIIFCTRAGVEMEISRNQIDEIETISGVMIDGEMRRPEASGDFPFLPWAGFAYNF